MALAALILSGTLLFHSFVPAKTLGRWFRRHSEPAVDQRPIVLPALPDCLRKNTNLPCDGIASMCTCAEASE